MLRTSVSIAIILWSSASAVLADAVAGQPVGARQAFSDRRDPPAWHALDDSTRKAFDLGQLVFNTSWVPAGTANAARRDGLGPLFVQASCDGCHNNGARGRGEPAGERLPGSFVMQLGGPATSYGAVINTQALAGFRAEGNIAVSWTTREGRYPDGSRWVVRVPAYEVNGLAYGVLPRDVVLRPRIGPALFGTGLLEAVDTAQLESIRRKQPLAQRGDLTWHVEDGTRQLGRFGWQADAISIEDQTARALAREMGLTSRPRKQDDCTAVQTPCREAPNGGDPEVSDEFLAALVTYQRELAVPLRAAAAAESVGQELFRRTGCVECHQPLLTAQPAGAAPLQIDAYTDLMQHDLGDGLADRTVSGSVVKSKWRTAPLWGMAHVISNGDLGLLHDGRARSVEEAILWHDGQARGSRRRFERLPASDRQALLKWVESL